MMDQCSLILLNQSTLNNTLQVVNAQNVRYYYLSLHIITTKNKKQEVNNSLGKVFYDLDKLYGLLLEESPSTGVHWVSLMYMQAAYKQKHTS